MIDRTIGHYKVVSKLGEGGMGEVYRARDSRLDRDVALKMLPEGLAADPDRLARFEREAKVLASLQHANIAAIHGIEESGAVRALVLELVEGPTLADRIAAGPIPVAEALAIARQIADALGYAHDAGVIHRDLKPANIKVKDDGTVKVLDFGLAKALGPAGSEDPASGASRLSDSPTLTAAAFAPGTQLGVILGTASYMAPEQARGKPVDRRADVWAFGVVLYEMLTGRRAFEGREISDVLAAVLKDTPSLAALPANVPAPVRRLLRRTLEKDRVKRLDSMTAARLELEDAASGDGPDAPGLKTRPPGLRAVAAGAIALALVSAAAAGFSVWRAMQPVAPEVRRLTITPDADTALTIETNHNDVAITPDGRQIVYFSRPSQNQFIVRSLDRFEPVILNTLGLDARGPAISFDGRWIAYQVGAPIGNDAQLTRIPIGGGSPSFICRFVGNMRGASWGADDTILLASTANDSGLLRVPAAGGTPEVLTTPRVADGETDHFWPHWLPDGRHALFAIMRSDRTLDVALLSLESKTWRVLVKNGTFPRYAPTGHLVYAAAGAIHAVPFDLGRLEVRGSPVEVQSGVVIKEAGAADFAFSADGTLVYLGGTSQGVENKLAWREPDGKETVLGFPLANYTEMRVSPDERSAVAVVGQQANFELWLLDLAREVSSRITTADYRASGPVWSRDSRQIAFWSPGRAGTTDPGGIFLIAASGTGQPERLTTAGAGDAQIPTSFTADGQSLLFTAFSTGASNIMRLSLDASRALAPVLAGPGVETQGALSPDGRWLAYTQIDQQQQVFIRPYPNVNQIRIPVTTDSGMDPYWARDGQSLYYRDRNLTSLHVVDVKASGDTLSVSAPRVFTSLRDSGNAFHNLAVPPVGRRVLTSVPVSGPARVVEYRVILNWFEELKRQTEK